MGLTCSESWPPAPGAPQLAKQGRPGECSRHFRADFVLRSRLLYVLPAPKVCLTDFSRSSLPLIAAYGPEKL